MHISIPFIEHNYENIDVQADINISYVHAELVCKMHYYKCSVPKIIIN
jgi:hypothetical protein